MKPRVPSSNSAALLATTNRSRGPRPAEEDPPVPNLRDEWLCRILNHKRWLPLWRLPGHSLDLVSAASHGWDGRLATRRPGILNHEALIVPSGGVVTGDNIMRRRGRVRLFENQKTGSK